MLRTHVKPLLLTLGALATALGGAGAARAEDGEPAAPPVLQASRTTHYIALPEANEAEVAALVERVRAALPGAQVELVGDALRVQADGDVLPAILRALGEAAAAEGLPGEGREPREPKPPHAPKEAGERKEPREPKDGREHEKAREREKAKERERAEKHGDAADAERAPVRVEVGRLCEGCAECLADALRREFPDARCAPDGDLHVKVLAGPRTHAAVQAWLAERRRALAQAARAEDEPARRHARAERHGLVLAGPGDREVHVLLGGEGRGERLRERLHEVERRVIRLREDDAPGGAFRAREGMRLRLDERERERDEAAERARKHDKPDARPAPKPGAKPPLPPVVRPDVARGEGPLAEARRRVEHLRQAAEHLDAAGWEGMAAQVRKELARVKQEAEQKAEALRRAEQERLQAEKVQAEKLRADRLRAEAARAQAEAARERPQAARPPEKATSREPAPGAVAAELLELVRALRREVEALRREVADLKQR